MHLSQILFNFTCLILIKMCDSQRELQNTEAPRFIASLIPQGNARNPENTRNIVLLRLDTGPSYKLFNDITKEIMKSCSDNPVIIHTNWRPYDKNTIRAVLFMIVTIDFFDLVDLKRKFIGKNLNFRLFFRITCLC